MYLCFYESSLSYHFNEVAHGGGRKDLNQLHIEKDDNLAQYFEYCELYPALCRALWYPERLVKLMVLFHEF